MEKELGSEVIRATQTSLGKYVKRPPLSDKLLKKPPFRFLHDLITSVSIHRVNENVSLTKNRFKCLSHALHNNEINS